MMYDGNYFHCYSFFYVFFVVVVVVFYEGGDWRVKRCSFHFIACGLLLDLITHWRHVIEDALVPFTKCSECHISAKLNKLAIQWKSSFLSLLMYQNQCYENATMHVKCEKKQSCPL